MKSNIQTTHAGASIYVKFINDFNIVNILFKKVAIMLKSGIEF